MQRQIQLPAHKALNKQWMEILNWIVNCEVKETATDGGHRRREWGKRTQSSLLSRLSKLRNIRTKTHPCHLQESHVGICDSPLKAISKKKIILTVFQMIGGNELLANKKLSLMICENCGLNHCCYWNAVSKVALGCFYEFSPHCRWWPIRKSFSLSRWDEYTQHPGNVPPNWITRTIRIYRCYYNTEDH